MAKALGRLGTRAWSALTGRQRNRSGVKVHGHVVTRCYRSPSPGAPRELIWEDVSDNVVVKQGLEYAIGVALNGASQIATWYCGLMYASPTVSATGTLGSHAGWTECTTYSAANRATWVEAFVASANNSFTLGNSASKAGFTLSVACTVGGVFLCSTNTGTSGTLYSGVAFTGGNRSLSTNDKLEVTYNQTLADDGS